MRPTYGLALLAVLFAGTASAEVTDPSMSCADYLTATASAGPTPKSGDAAADKMMAEMDAKLNAYCKANPKANAGEAAMKMMGG
jgi:hypothetical protein